MRMRSRPCRRSPSRRSPIASQAFRRRSRPAPFFCLLGQRLQSHRCWHILSIQRRRSHPPPVARRADFVPIRCLRACSHAMLAALVCLLAAPARAPAQTATLADLAMYSGPDRTARLIAGAKKEGVVNVYSSFTVDDLKLLGAAFEKKYGIKLNMWRSSSEDIL